MLISVQLFVQGDHLQPEAITELLRVKPEIAYALGDAWTSASGQVYFRKIGLWKWGITENSQAANLSAVAINFCSILSTNAEYLAKLPNADRAWVDIFICHEPEQGESNDINFSLSPSAIQQIYTLGLSIEFTTSLISNSDG